MLWPKPRTRKPSPDLAVLDRVATDQVAAQARRARAEAHEVQRDMRELVAELQVIAAEFQAHATGGFVDAR